MGQKRIDAMDLTSELSRFLFSVGLCAVLVIGVKWLGTDRRFARPRAMARRAIALVARLRPHHAIMVAANSTRAIELADRLAQVVLATALIGSLSVLLIAAL